MSIETMIDALAAGKNAEASTMFKQEIGSRISDAIESKKVEIGASIYNKAEQED
jgi:hypothetical protein|tara:strand:+ start:6549 stop:6710 length:162 start_codon:yes stop_codon:yes gene_type:complete